MMVAKTVETYGRIDGAYNNAGIEGRWGPIRPPATEENFDRTIAINLKGVWLCMKYEIPQMLKQGGGVIVNTASVAGLVGFVRVGGLQRLQAWRDRPDQDRGARIRAKEYSSQLRLPGRHPDSDDRADIDSGQMNEDDVKAFEPVGRLGQPSEIGEGVVWLLSDASSFVTGHSMVIDGGWVAR